ncbi:MAG: hypothetical protein HY888_04575 [Deltaproteobacteria bacterium]|nr:hypothetical protein [Deltaproteobacteria bacterium]
MSYILDALKKVEREKIKKTAMGGMTSISGDLFQTRVPRTARGGAWKIIVAAVLVSLVTFTATWFVLKGEKKQGAVASRSSIKAPDTAVAVPPAATAPIMTAQPSPPAVSPPVNAQPKNVPSDESARNARAENKLAQTPPVSANMNKSAVQTVPARADIKVSGVAWQEERSARRAVVNGFLMQEGKSVAGAKILEIHQDRVRFTSPTGIFDVRMDAASLSGMPK